MSFFTMKLKIYRDLFLLVKSIDPLLVNVPSFCPFINFEYYMPITECKVVR